MPEQVQCPSCSAPLRVPDTLLGKNVKCPKCKTTFLAELEESEKPQGIVREPEPSAARRRRPSPPQDEELEEIPDEEEEEDIPMPRRRRRHRRSAVAAAGVAGPAIALMVISGLAVAFYILSLILNLFMGGVAASLRSQQQQSILRQQLQSPPPGPRGFGMQPMPIPPPAPQSSLSPRTMQAIEFFGGAIGNAIGMVYWIVVLVGAVKMKGLSSYGFAMTSCIMSMLPCSCCCILGLPFGIWGLTALNKPGVKDAFS